jgi:hypothetical protein
MGVFKYNNLLTYSFLTSPEIMNLSGVELSNKLNLKPYLINRYRRKLKLSSVYSSKLKLGKIMRGYSLPDWQIGLIVGTLLGDSNLCKRSSGVRLRMSHGAKQKEYIELKYKLLHSLTVGDIHKGLDVKTNSVYYNFSTVQHPDLEKLYDLFYKDNIKYVSEEALDLLTIPGLVLWFFDDGSRDSNVYDISTCSFTLEDHKILRKYLFKKFGIKTTPLPRNNGTKTYWRLYVARDSSKILQKYLLDFYIPCMRHKIINPKSIQSSSETTRKALWDDLISQSEDIVRTLQ